MNSKLDGGSLDIEKVEMEKLRSIFPQCFIEGELNIDKLLALCGVHEQNDFEKYKFEWKGKGESLRLAQQRSMGTLRPCPQESVDWDTTQNIYIEGDNLEVLKLLQTAYYRKVKMIYIDPPYNTGKDFVYEDDFADPIGKYKEVTAQTTKSNPETMGRFHTNWLNMMYPRLRLAANLLTDNGVIFISIDDGELYNLRKVCDEVFGEENFVGNIIWNNATDNNPTQIAIEHEYVLCYVKNKQYAEPIWKTKVSAVKDLLIEIGNKLIHENPSQEVLQKKYTEWFRIHKSQLWPLDRYKYIDADGIYTGSQSVHNPGRGGYRYDVIHPKTAQPCKQPLMGYRFPETTMKELLDKDKILFGEDHNKIIELKVYAKEYEEKLSSIFELDGRIGSYDMKSLFGEKPVFSNPKPVQLLERLISFTLNDNDIVLDFFSGSATMAHAIIKLNKLDGKRRKFICVQLPENLDANYEIADSKAKEIIKNSIEFLDSIGKPHYITEIGKERIRRAGAKIKAEWEAEQAKKENVLFAEDEKIQTDLDTGFKVFKLDTSNLKTWDPTPVDSDNNQQIDIFLERLNDMNNTIKPERSDMDVVYEVMLKMGVPPTHPVTQVEIKSKTAYSIGEECLLLICLQDGLTAEIIECMAEDYQPSKMILSEKCFVDDTAMANAHYILKEREIELKLV